jgi:hypothetical protein
MPSLSTTYLLPALLLNPAFVLHLINTTVSYFTAPLYSITMSPHPFMDSIGPKRDTGLYMDMHADDTLCWGYTAVMVVVQLLAFGRVQDNRVQRRERREAKRVERVERERVRREEVERERCRKEEPLMYVVGKMNRCAGGLDGVIEVPAWEKLCGNGRVETDEIVLRNGNTRGKVEIESEYSGEESFTETSEEEMIV